MSGLTWRQLREAIDKIPPEQLDKMALTGDRIEEDNPYMIMDLVLDSDWGGALIILES